MKNFIGKYYVSLIIICIIIIFVGVTFRPKRSEPQQPQKQLPPEKAPLEYYLVAIDPGHGGRDGGSDYDAVKEKDINLAIAKRIKTVYQSWKGQIMLTREGDYRVTELYPNERTKQRRDLSGRIKVAQEENADLLVSIHVNAASSALKGPMVFYQKDNETSKELGGSIIEQLHNVERHQQQDLIGADYFILNQANIPAVLVEVGFITHPEEREKLQAEEYQEQLACAIAEGIKNFLLSKERHLPRT